MNKKLRVCIILILILVISFVCAIELKGYETDKVIEDFISRGIYQKTENKIAYYKVTKKYEYENTSDRIIDNYDDVYVGTTGDIYISSKDPLSFFLTEYISNNIRIGHSAVVKSEDAKVTVEVTGNDGKKNNVVKEYTNDWFTEKHNEITVLRVKEVDSEDKEKLNNWLEDNYGKPYNYFFLYHMKNRFYCLDLCSSAFESINKNIDGNSLITFGSTLINNENTYIIYYKKRVNKKDINYEIYYLSEE